MDLEAHHTGRAAWQRPNLQAERTRLEALLAEDRRWTHAGWGRRYLCHPLTSALATRLLWQCEVAGTWRTGLPVDSAGRMADVDRVPIPTYAGMRIRLWHPLQVDPAELERVRQLLPEDRFPQPFPQVFRRVYVATPAEGVRSLLSDRLAGYLLPWHEGVNWLHARGWRSIGSNHSRIARFDRYLESVGVRAELFLIAARNVSGDLCTPTVRFRRWEANRRWRYVGLLDVPSLVFSEVLYDLGLLVETHAVGVVTNEEDDRIQSAKSRVAASRREMLAAAVAALGIADRCQITASHLRVRGNLRTYRIDLANGDVVIEPGAQPLCLVHASRFEQTPLVLRLADDDAVLSLVVSETVLLANDSAIKDPSIACQLG
jgi:hypothetical protein